MVAKESERRRGEGRVRDVKKNFILDQIPSSSRSKIYNSPIRLITNFFQHNNHSISSMCVYLIFALHNSVINTDYGRIKFFVFRGNKCRFKKKFSKLACSFSLQLFLAIIFVLYIWAKKKWYNLFLLLFISNICWEFPLATYYILVIDCCLKQRWDWIFQREDWAF